MGRSKALKQIRKIAKGIPVVTMLTQEKQFVSGSVFLENGHTETEAGNKINPTETYKENFPVVMAINHTRRMKKLYDKYGKTGLSAYVDGIQDHVKQ